MEEEKTMAIETVTKYKVSSLHLEKRKKNNETSYKENYYYTSEKSMTPFLEH